MNVVTNFLQGKKKLGLKDTIRKTRTTFSIEYCGRILITNPKKESEKLATHYPKSVQH